MPAGVLNARKVRRSDRVKPKPDESLNLDNQPPENHQKSIMKHAVTLVPECSERFQTVLFRRFGRTNQRCFVLLNMTYPARHRAILTTKHSLDLEGWDYEACRLQSDWMPCIKAARWAVNRVPTRCPFSAVMIKWRRVESQPGNDRKGVTLARVDGDPFAGAAFAVAAKFG